MAEFGFDFLTINVRESALWIGQKQVVFDPSMAILKSKIPLAEFLS